MCVMKLLTFNCHEAWVYQLGALNCELDIIVGLKGRYTEGWDSHMRPLPKNAKLVALPDIINSETKYDCIITHNITDLLEVKSIPGPRIVVLHTTLEGRAVNEQSQIPVEQAKALLQQYLGLVGGHAVAISALKGKSWGMVDDVVRNGVNVKDYLPYDGGVAAGLRVSNEINKRKEILLWGFHQQVFSDLPVTIIGQNLDMEGVLPANDWQDLKLSLSKHRFFIHTADARYEDGYNFATLEAMAAGLPVLGNCNPTTPIEHGVSGFLSDNPAELRGYAE